VKKPLCGDSSKWGDVRGDQLCVVKTLLLGSSKAIDEGAWVREAAVAYAAKQKQRAAA
jgi:hypothetical protein